VTDAASVEHAVNSVLAQAGRLDVLVNNAGMGLAGISEARTRRGGSAVHPPLLALNPAGQVPVMLDSPSHSRKTHTNPSLTIILDTIVEPTMQEQTMSERAARKAIGGVHPLDEVVWNALTSKQSRFALGDDRILRFPAEIAPFAAMIDASPASFEALRKLIEAQGPAALVTPGEVSPPAGFSVIRRAVLLQMIWQGGLAPTSAWEHVRLAERDVPEMVALTAATEPGPFGPRTIELGDYIGARRQGKLAAMAGERMRLDGYTEISAVCVDTAFRGQGYAGGLMKLLVAAICARAETPFLHVLASNHGALALYRALGFVERREMHLTVLGGAKA
jgi:ribosomal protein S18 acetylase RimI-like enzyme